MQEHHSLDNDHDDIGEAQPLRRSSANTDVDARTGSHEGFSLKAFRKETVTVTGTPTISCTFTFEFTCSFAFAFTCFFLVGTLSTGSHWFLLVVRMVALSPNVFCESVAHGWCGCRWTKVAAEPLVAMGVAGGGVLFPAFFQNSMRTPSCLQTI